MGALLSWVCSSSAWGGDHVYLATLCIHSPSLQHAHHHQGQYFFKLFSQQVLHPALLKQNCSCSSP